MFQTRPGITQAASCAGALIPQPALLYIFTTPARPVRTLNPMMIEVDEKLIIFTLDLKIEDVKAG